MHTQHAPFPRRCNLDTAQPRLKSMKLRQTLVALLVTVLAAVGMSACTNSGSKTSTLTIVTSDWNGWDPNYVPKPVQTVVEITPGMTIDLDTWDLELTIKSISKDKVTVEFNQAMVPDGTGDYMNAKKTFDLDPGSTAKFDTPTMDAGAIIELTLSS